MMSRFRILLGVYGAVVALWLVAPTLVVIPISFSDKQSLSFPPTGWSWQWYARFFSNPAWFGSFMHSLQIAVSVSIIATVLGTLAAFGLFRLEHPAAGFARALLVTPMIIPGVVLSIGIYAVFLELKLIGTFWGFVAAHTLLAIPLVLISVGASLAVYDHRLEMAAASLGANRVRTFLTVTLPLIAPGVLSGLLFAFITSFDEVIVSLFITSPTLTTLPPRMFINLTTDADPTAAAVATMIFVITTITIGLGTLLVVRRKEKTA